MKARLAERPGTAAGVLLVLAGLIILMGTITAEALYPAPYATDVNTISDLGGTRPPEGIVRQPSAAIFDTTMVVSGLLILAAAYLIKRGGWTRRVTLPLALLGAGVLGVGVFPGNTSPHPLFAMTAFISGGIAGVLTAKVLPRPLGEMSAVLGAIALIALALGIFLVETEPIASLGEGGIERWVAYPVVIWLIMFGGFLSGRGSQPREGEPGT
jgi:hypothetical membrane protein